MTEAMMGEWKSLNFPGIYKITHVASGKVYVGQSQNIAKRIVTHARVAGCRHLWNALQKYGLNAFSVDLLERVDDISALDEREQFWISATGSQDTNLGYNIKPGGKTTRGFTQSSEVKAKIGAANRGKKRTPEQIAAIAERSRNMPAETRAKISAANMVRGGYPHTAESRQKLSECHIGVGHTPETCAKLSANHIGVPHPHTKEQDEKISAAQRARCGSNEKAAIVDAYILEHPADGIAKIARATGVHEWSVPQYAKWTGWHRVANLWVRQPA